MIKNQQMHVFRSQLSAYSFSDQLNSTSVIATTQIIVCTAKEK